MKVFMERSYVGAISRPVARDEASGSPQDLE